MDTWTRYCEALQEQRALDATRRLKAARLRTDMAVRPADAGSNCQSSRNTQAHGGAAGAGAGPGSGPVRVGADRLELVG